MNWLDILTTATKYIPGIYERCVIYWGDCTIGQIAFNDTIVSLKISDQGLYRSQVETLFYHLLNGSHPQLTLP